MDVFGTREILGQLRAVWQVDDSVVEPINNGFHWWPGHHRVTAQCDQWTDDDGGADYWRISVRTEFLKGADLGDPKVRAVLGGLATLAPTYSWVYVPPDVVEKFELTTDGSISFQSTAYVRPEVVDWLPTFFAQLAIMQPIDAQRLAEPGFAGLMGVTANLSGPRVLGMSRQLDDILYVGQEIYAPNGRLPSRWAGCDEFEEIVERYGHDDACVGSVEPGGLNLEIPFGSTFALIRLRHDVAHPALGNGLIASIQLPYFGTEDAIQEVCSTLNFLASVYWIKVPVLASWHPRQVDGEHFLPAYAACVPNALYAPGLATNMALWSIGLAQWARESLWPDI